MSSSGGDNTKHEAFGPLPDPLMGLKEGIRARRGG